jgi:Flp pilus assembly protein TadG
MTRSNQRGQASVELALALPLLAMWLLATVQVVLIARDQLAVVHAAREGARAAAVSTSPSGAAASAATSAITQSPLSVSTAAGSKVTVTVTYRTRTDVPLVGALIPDYELHSTATMQWEP